MQKMPIVNALLRLSEGGSLRPEELRDLARHVPSFLEQARLGYVVINRSRASTELVTAVTHLLLLTYVAADGPYELYRPPLRPIVDDTPRP